MLNIVDLHVDYDGFQVLRGVNLAVESGELVCLLGPNGAGKSTLMNSITGLVPARRGKIVFLGQPIQRLPTHRIIALGIAHVLERRRVFPDLTVRENLSVGSYLPEARRRRAETLKQVCDRLPMLGERLNERAGILSGGQQQQLAIGRGLMSRPKFMLLDEPFLGLSPAIAQGIEKTIREIRDSGITVLFIEQNVERALALADRGYILESGRVAVTGSADELMRHPRVMDVYLGAHRGRSDVFVGAGVYDLPT